MYRYPIEFNAALVAGSGTQTRWTSSSDNHEIPCAIPKEFNGPAGGLSPEGLFAQALLNCFSATFLVMAEKSSLRFESLSADGKLTVERDESGRPVMKTFHFVIQLHGCEAQQRAAAIVKKALESGFILNSVRTQITHELSFNDARPRRAELLEDEQSTAD